MANEPQNEVVQEEQKPVEPAPAPAPAPAPIPQDFKFGFLDWLGLILSLAAVVLLIVAKIILNFQPDSYFTIRGVFGIFILLLAAGGACYNFFRGDRRFTVDFWVSTGVLGFCLFVL